MRAARLSIALLAAKTAVAAPVGCGVTPAKGDALASLALDDLDGRFAALRGKLAKGLTVTLAHGVATDDGRTFSFGCKIFYDLWDEVYVVTPLIGSVVAAQKKERAASLTQLPPACRTVRLPWASVGAGVVVDSALDPVSAEQEAKTRRWLAEKGIADAGASFGRAALALVDLRQEDSFTRRCPASAPR